MKIYKIKLVIYLVITFQLLIFFPSCDDDFLTEKPTSFLAPESVFINTTGFDAALAGIYGDLKDIYFGYYNTQQWGCFFAGTDMGTPGLRWAHHVIAENYGATMTSEWAVSKSIWDWGYTLIGNANQILAYAGNEDVAWDDPSDRNRVEAEARFLRAWVYRFLAYSFGDLPIVEELAKPFRLDYTRQSLSEVIDLMIEDFSYAAENLPETTETEGKLVKAAAQHMLAEIYLFDDQPDKAEVQAKLAINSGDYQLMTNRFGNYTSEPGDVFSDLFKENNSNRSSGNLESIWVWQFQYEAPVTNHTVYTRYYLIPYYARIQGMVISDSLGGRGVGRIRPLDFWLDAYESQDMRNSQYNLRRHYWYNNSAYPNLYGKEVEMTPALAVAGSLFPHTRKYDWGDPDKPGENYSYKDIILIRLAETYLLLAEAQMKQNKLDEAAATINLVRERSNATLISSSDVDMDFILDERARELGWEEFRRFTLVRTKTLINRVKAYNPVSGLTIQDYNLYWPIPQSAIDGNTEAELTQNIGYN